MIVHIQDVHMNPQAQWNIRQTVRSLLEAKQVDLLALEGATEEIELQPFVDFPRRHVVKITADFLLKEGKISGPIHAALTAKGKLPTILGIDDPAHYQANVQAYKDSAPVQEKARAEIKSQMTALAVEKTMIFCPALLAFDKQVQAYRSGATSLANYIFSLTDVTRSHHPGTGLAGIQVSPFPHVSLFQKALTLEKKLNFKQVEHERAQLIDRLVRNLTPQFTQSLLAQSAAYRSGQLRYADFYQEIKSLCQKADVRLSDYPAMNDYVKYVLMADGIDGECLMEELEDLEKTAYNTLAQTEEEKSLVDKDRRVWLTSKLVDFALTPKEWELLRNTPRPFRTTLAGIHKNNQRNVPGLWIKPFGADQQLGASKAQAVKDLPKPDPLKSFNLFYQEALARDEAMAHHLLAASQSIPSAPHRPPILALVTGGFHAPGLTAALSKTGATVISFVPKIEKADTAQGSAYLSVFTQEKTPLEKLFSGEKLFLASPPLSRYSRAFLSFYAWAQALWLGKGHINEQALAHLESLRGGVRHVTKDLVYKRGRLFLQTEGKEIEIISDQGNLNFNPFMGSVKDLKKIPLGEMILSIIKEFPQFVLTRVSVVLSDFVFTKHKKKNISLDVLVLRMVGIQRVALASDIGVGLGLLVGFSFGLPYFFVTWFGIYFLAHAIQIVLNPIAPAMADGDVKTPIQKLTDDGRLLVSQGKLKDASQKFEEAVTMFLEQRKRSRNNKLLDQDLSFWITQTRTEDVFKETAVALASEETVSGEMIGKLLRASLDLSSSYFTNPEPFLNFLPQKREPILREDAPLLSQLHREGPIEPNPILASASNPILYTSRQGKRYVVKYLGWGSFTDLLALKLFRRLGFSTADTRHFREDPGLVRTPWIDGTVTVEKFIENRLIKPNFFKEEAIREKLFPIPIRDALESSKLASMIVECADFNLRNVLLHVDNNGNLLPEPPVFFDFERTFFFQTIRIGGRGVEEKKYRDGFSLTHFNSNRDTNRMTNGEPLFHRNAKLQHMRALFDTLKTVTREEIETIVDETIAEFHPAAPLESFEIGRDELVAKLDRAIGSALALENLIDEIPPMNARTSISQKGQVKGWINVGASWVRDHIQFREGLIALGVAIFMGAFYIILGAFYPELFGHLSRLDTLSIIMGTGVLNGVITWWLVNRWQNASRLKPASFWPIFLTQLVFFGPLFGFVGNEALRLVPGFAGIAPHWVQALVGQFIVAPFVFDPLSYVVMRRFVYGETNGDLFRGLKKNMLPYVVLNAILWTPIAALGLSFPNNAATNIVASVGGIFAGAIGLLFVLRERLPGLKLDSDNINKIRFRPLRSVARFLNWFFDRTWLPKYLLSLIALGYGAFAGLVVASIFPASNVWFFIVITTTLGLAAIFNSEGAMNYLINGKFKKDPSGFETPKDPIQDRLTGVAQPFVDFLASADVTTEIRPDVFVVSGSNDLKAYIVFAKIWKSLGSDIPVVVAGGRGSGTIVLVRKCLSFYDGRLTPEQKTLLEKAIPTDASITERDILLKVVFPLEGISNQAVQQWFHDETRPSRTTGENMLNVSEIVERVLGQTENASVALVNTPIVLLRQSMYATQIWNKKLQHPWRIWRFPTYRPILAEMDVNELLETLARLVGSPDPSQWDFTLKGELKGIRDALKDNPGSLEIDFSDWENIIAQTIPLYKEFVESQSAQYDPVVKLLMINVPSPNQFRSSETNDFTRAIAYGMRPLLLGAVVTAVLSLEGLANWAVPAGVIAALAIHVWGQGWLGQISLTPISWLRRLRTPLLISAFVFFQSGEPAAANRGEGTPPTTIIHSPKNVPEAVTQTLHNLNARPTDLGLENSMDLKAREIVGQAARRAKITSIDPWLKEGKGVNVLILDKRSVANTAQRTALNTFLSNKKNVAIITNDESFTAEGTQILHRPNAFSPLLAEIENELVPSGIVEVSIQQLSADLKSIGQGMPLQFFQTNVIKLNANGVVDEDLIGLTKRSWMLSETFKILSPAESIDWSKILGTLAEIARHA